MQSHRISRGFAKFWKKDSRETSADLSTVMSLRRHHWRSESRLDTGVCLESWKCPSWSYLLGIEGQEVLHWLGGRTSNQFKWLGVVKLMVIVRATVIITVLILLRITNIAIRIVSILVYISSFSATLLGYQSYKPVFDYINWIVFCRLFAKSHSDQLYESFLSFMRLLVFPISHFRFTLIAPSFIDLPQVILCHIP